MTYDDPRVVANPTPAKSIPGRVQPLSRQKTGKAFKTRFTVKNKARWTVVTASNAKFEKLDNNLVKPDKIPEAVRNKQHNRFMDIVPNPQTRVQMSSLPGDPTSDYYNANYIEGPNGESRAYIAAMGFVITIRIIIKLLGLTSLTFRPLPTNLTHFWRMIWDNNVQIIVMLTGLVEKGQTKCERYWPSSSLEPAMKFGPVAVATTEVNVGNTPSDCVHSSNKSHNHKYYL